MITTNALPAASGKGRLITLWILSGLIALAILGASGAKLAGVAVLGGSPAAPVALFVLTGIIAYLRKP